MGFFFLGYVLVLSTVLLDDDGLLPSVLWVVPLQVLKLLVVLYITTRHVDVFVAQGRIVPFWNVNDSWAIRQVVLEVQGE